MILTQTEAGPVFACLQQLQTFTLWYPSIYAVAVELVIGQVIVACCPTEAAAVYGQFYESNSS